MKEINKKPDGPDENPNMPGQYELFTKVIKAGKKTYFFDVRQSRSDEHYLVITESAKKIDDEGKPFYKRHKVFVSHEDLSNFREGLDNAMEFLNSLGEVPSSSSREDAGRNREQSKESDNAPTIADFDDLSVSENKTQ